jgi:hypothetical protein
MVLVEQSSQKLTLTMKQVMVQMFNVHLVQLLTQISQQLGGAKHGPVVVRIEVLQVLLVQQ